VSLEQKFSFIVINWVANPFRGDKFEAAWAPAAEAATKYGARGWAFTRSKDDPLSFMQLAAFENKIDFERYWLAEDTAAARVRCGGLYQVPVLPIWFRSVGFGVISETLDDVEAA
jgi:hypothetical protein